MEIWPEKNSSEQREMLIEQEDPSSALSLEASREIRREAVENSSPYSGASTSNDGNQNISSSTDEGSCNISRTESLLLMDTSKQDFSIIRTYPAYVDKSLLIKAILDGPACILLIAPRRFGKSVNLDMLRRFFEKSIDQLEIRDNRKLFEGLEIEKHQKIIEKHFAKYPTICLDFKVDEPITCYDDAFAAVRGMVHGLYRKHEYLMYSDKIANQNKTNIEYISKWCDRVNYKSFVSQPTDITEGLKNLAEYLCIHFDVKKIYLFVDEYDNICSKSIFGVTEDGVDGHGKPTTAEREIFRIVELCVGAVGCLAKGNPNVDRVVVTGISYLMTQGLSTINNLKDFRFQENHRYAKFYGMCTNEVKTLLEKFKLGAEFEIVERFYNGYASNMFSTLSIMEYLNSKWFSPESIPDNYWKESGMISNLSVALHIPCVKSTILGLLVNLSRGVEIFHFRKVSYKDLCELKSILSEESSNISNADIFYNFLLEEGYFSIVEKKENNMIVIRIPNKEIRTEFLEKLADFYATEYKLDINIVKLCACEFDKMSSCNSADEIKTHFREIYRLLNVILRSFEFSSKNEATFHHVIFIIAFYCTKFECFSELRSSDTTRKILDLCLLNFEHKFGIVIELKYMKSADKALEQILNKRYYDVFKNEKCNPDKIKIDYELLVGMDMSSNQKVEISLLINSYDINKKIVFDD